MKEKLKEVLAYILKKIIMFIIGVIVALIACYLIYLIWMSQADNITEAFIKMGNS